MLLGGRPLGHGKSVLEEAGRLGRLTPCPAGRNNSELEAWSDFQHTTIMVDISLQRTQRGSTGRYFFRAVNSFSAVTGSEVILTPVAS